MRFFKSAIARKIMARAEPVSGQSSVTEVVDEFYEDVATEETGRYWWWVQMVLLEPNELIVNDGQDNLFRIPFTIGGVDEGEPGEAAVTFGDPTPVRIEYIDVAARSVAVQAACAGIAQVRGESKIAARFQTRAESRPQSREGESVNVEALRTALGLSADTPDEEVLKTASERIVAQANAEPEPEPDPEPSEPEPQPEPEPAPEPEAEGVVSIDAGALASLRAEARQGAEARAHQIAQEDERLLVAAVKSGKFPPSRKEHWAKLLKADRQGTTETIDGLEENVIPVAARGVNPEGGEGQGNVQEHEAMLGAWFPDIAARKARIAAGARPRVVNDKGEEVAA